MVTQSIKDADTFFGVELPALTEWTFGPEQAAAIRKPVLSVIGADTQPLWVEIAEFLQIQRPEPVAQALAEFLTRNPIAADDARRLQPDDPAQPLRASPA